jgi:hypothetical protein
VPTEEAVMTDQSVLESVPFACTFFMRPDYSKKYSQKKYAVPLLLYTSPKSGYEQMNNIFAPYVEANPGTGN